MFWVVEHGHHTTLTPARLMVAFFVAGVLGLLASAALEIWLVPSRMLPNLWVGLIEEAVKAVGLLLVGRGLARYRVRDGIILGATVGLGFGAFEAAGYSLSYSVQSGAFSARDLVSEELLRAVIAPFGHGVWTALVGAAAFATAARARQPARVVVVDPVRLHVGGAAARGVGRVVERGERAGRRGRRDARRRAAVVVHVRGRGDRRLAGPAALACG